MSILAATAPVVNLAADPTGYTPADLATTAAAQLPTILAWVGAGVGGGLALAFAIFGIYTGVGALFKMMKKGKTAGA